MKIKVLNDFNPKKTNLCITSSAERSPEVSKLRTVKAMRASLAGIPILSPTWISHCVEHNSIQEPEETMLIQTLPTKEDKYMKKITKTTIPNETAHGGVFAIAAKHETLGQSHQSPNLFNGLYVHLSGPGWKKSPAKTKDVHLLLKESGAHLLNSVNVVTKTLTKGLDTGSTFVLLCDGNINSLNPAFPANLKSAVENAISDKQCSVLVVDSKWLFDSISCAEVLAVTQYQPQGKIVKPLWQSIIEN